MKKFLSLALVAFISLNLMAQTVDARPRISRNTKQTTIKEDRQSKNKSKNWMVVPPVVEEEEPVIEEPIIEEPIIEEPVIEEPITEEPITEEPITEEPITEEPIIEGPIIEEPIIEEPIIEEPVIEVPVIEESPYGFNVLELGAKGDGVTNDTSAIQEALNSYDTVYIPDGTYLIDVNKALLPKSNQKITLSENAVLQAIPTSSGNYSVFDLYHVSHVTITGGTIVGERYEHKGTSGEWGMGILVGSGSENVLISNVTLRDFWGDGIYLGGTPYVSNITIEDVISENNRRQGLSITNAKDVLIKDSIFRNTNGALPEAGIDIEPNQGQITQNITIQNVEAYHNNGVGIDIMGLFETVEGIEIKDTISRDNEGSGFRIINARDLAFSNVVSSNNYYGIEMPRDVFNATFEDMSITNNYFRGLSIIGTNQKEGIDNLEFINSTFSNNSQWIPGNEDGVRIDNYDLSGYVNNISFMGCKFIDDQSKKTQRYGITVGYSQNMNNIFLDAATVFQGNISGNLIGGSSLVLASK